MRNQTQVILLLALVLMVSGCAYHKVDLPQTDNDRIIREVNKCEKAGMGYRIIYHSWTVLKTEVQCVPNEN